MAMIAMIPAVIECICGHPPIQVQLLVAGSRTVILVTVMMIVVMLMMVSVMMALASGHAFVLRALVVSIVMTPTASAATVVAAMV